MTGALLVLLALGAIALSALARRWRLQSGLLILVVAGAASFLPGPRLELEPELILGLVVPPLLYAAALEFSLFSFMRNLRAIVGLGVWLVLATFGITGWVTSLLLPTLGYAAATVLAAIVAPPDTVTITAKGERVGLTRRVSAILTGESLVNDAMALTLFSLAVSNVAGTETFIDRGWLLFLYSVVLGAVTGFLIGELAVRLRAKLADPTLNTAIGLVLPFAAYLAAEHLHASGILAVVGAGFSVSLNSAFGLEERGDNLDYRTRTTEQELWPVIGALLEAFVFAYTGLQLRWVIEELDESGEPVLRTVLAGLAIVVLLVVVRIVWVFYFYWRNASRLRGWERRLNSDDGVRRRMEEYNADRVARGKRPRETPTTLDARETMLVAWAGMRGIVTLGAAAGIPLLTAAGEPFPHRTQLQFLAYVVVIGTLLLQAPTLPWLARWLSVDLEKDHREREEALAQAVAVAEAAVADAPGGRVFDAQRTALSRAVSKRELDDEAARTVIQRIDRAQAAAEAP